VVFVDDDNELAANYLSVGVEFARAHPQVACFGGKLLLPKYLRTAPWVEPFLPYLGIKDLGDFLQVGRAETWVPWEPPTAGAWVRRDLLAAYLESFDSQPTVKLLGRVGSNGLGSCEDSLMMRLANRLGASSAYVPQLELQHHLHPRRLKFAYLIRLIRAYGESHVLLEKALNGSLPIPDYYRTDSKFLATLLWSFKRDSKRSLPYAISKVLYHLKARATYRKITSPEFRA
jgi:hypothetical protein